MRLLPLLALLYVSCGTQPPDVTPLRLGYFPNLTHAPAIIGIEDSLFQHELGSEFVLETRVLNAGPAAVEALFSDAIDIAYIGPNPAINAFQKSKGEAIRVIVGSASGGTALVVQPSIKNAQQLRGKRVATPQLGNTQDVALRAWLLQNGLSATREGGGDVAITPQENAQTLETFRAGQVQGAWLPEPWASRLVVEAGAKMLVDENTLWPEGRYTTALVVVRTEYLKDHAEAVGRFVRAHLRALDTIKANPTRAQQIVNDHLGRLMRAKLTDEVLQSAWSRITFTHDPLMRTLERSARDAHRLGFIASEQIAGMADLGALNGALRTLNRPAVSQ